MEAPNHDIHLFHEYLPIHQILVNLGSSNSSTQFIWILWTVDFSFLTTHTLHLPYLGYKFHLLNNTIHTPITHRTMLGQDCELFLNGEDWIHTFLF